MTASSGETNLTALLRGMSPALHAEPYAFCTVTDELAPGLWPVAVGLFREIEGVTVVLPSRAADAAGLAYADAWACITLTVHSSLSAVGFLAAISARLAAAGISLNPVAGFHHDHLFVPWDRRHDALAVLDSIRTA